MRGCSAVLHPVGNVLRVERAARAAALVDGAAFWRPEKRLFKRAAFGRSTGGLVPPARSGLKIGGFGVAPTQHQPGKAFESVVEKSASHCCGALFLLT